MSKSSKIAKGGLFTALSLILIYLSSIMPTNKLALISAASFIIPISILNIGVKMTSVVYLAVSILALILIPSKGIAIFYILFFGLYGFVKLYIEKIRKLSIELFLKLSFFNIVLVFCSFLYTQFFAAMINIEPYTKYLIPVIILAQVAFIAYDYLVSLLIQYYKNKM